MHPHVIPSVSEGPGRRARQESRFRTPPPAQAPRYDIWPVALLLLLLLTGCRREAPTLCLHVEGRRPAGMPVVVFEAGLGDTASSFAATASVLAKTTQVVRYDRAGLGCSPPATTPRMPSVIAAELHESLRRAGIRPPYLLVSHSAGVWSVSAFAAQHPEEVTGLVLIDPTPATFWKDIAPLQTTDERHELDVRMEKYGRSAGPGRLAEWQARDAAAAEYARIVLPHDVPLTVISAEGKQPFIGPAVRRYWHEQHARLARSSARGRLVVTNTSHYVHHDDPQLVIDEILRLLRNS